jgi:hypothetical protein
LPTYATLSLRRWLKGKQARRWLRDSLKDELRYQRDSKAREKAGDN